MSVESPKDPASLTTRLSSTAHAFLATRSWDQRAGAATDRALAVGKTLHSDSSAGGESVGGGENFSTFDSA